MKNYFNGRRIVIEDQPHSIIPETKGTIQGRTLATLFYAIFSTSLCNLELTLLCYIDDNFKIQTP